MKLLHGSEYIIENPEYGKGNPNNDYGLGFYCTESEELAKEWACKNNSNGFVNVFNFNLDRIKVLNLLDEKHTVLNWIATLLQYRTFRLDSEIAISTKKYLIENFSLNINNYDLVLGYRADDSYFQYAESFISNTLPLSGLNKALLLGELGIQTVLVSKKAFNSISFVEAYPVNKDDFYPKFIDRDKKAREVYKNEIKNSKFNKDDIFAMDILRGEMKNDDTRIQ